MAEKPAPNSLFGVLLWASMKDLGKLTLMSLATGMTEAARDVFERANKARAFVSGTGKIKVVNKVFSMQIQAQGSK